MPQRQAAGQQGAPAGGFPCPFSPHFSVWVMVPAVLPHVLPACSSCSHYSSMHSGRAGRAVQFTKVRAGCLQTGRRRRQHRCCGGAVATSAPPQHRQLVLACPQIGMSTSRRQLHRSRAPPGLPPSAELAAIAAAAVPGTSAALRVAALTCRGEGCRVRACGGGGRPLGAWAQACRVWRLRPMANVKQQRTPVQCWQRRPPLLAGACRLHSTPPSWGVHTHVHTLLGCLLPPSDLAGPGGLWGRRLERHTPALWVS